MEFPNPSAYTPFFRRFSNERARELEEVRDLHAQVKARQDAFKEDIVSVGKRVYPFYNHLPDDVANQFSFAMFDILKTESYFGPLPPPDFERMNLKQFVEYRNLLYAKEYFFANATALLELLDEGLIRTLYGVARDLPEMEDPSPFTIPLIYALPDPRDMVEKMYGTLADERYVDRGLFKPIAERLYRNICVVSGRDPDDPKSRKPVKLASESTLPLDELVDKYLGGTPYQALFKAPVPLKLTHEDRFNHMHIVGGTGAGKTTLIENLILHDLASPDPPSLVVIDPHGDLIKKLTHADLGLEDRLIVVDPRDVKHPPALNIFALNRERMGSYDEATQEQVTAGVIQTFDYLFTGLLGADLTAKQGVFFRYIARLMLALPETMGRNATILDMMRLMSDASPYQQAIDQLPEIPREFFLRDFTNKTFAQTKEQIRYRLQAIIENPTLARLFTSPETKIDLFTEMNRGAVVLVDTAKDFLKGGSANFGRIFISLVLQAVLERSAIPAYARKPTFLIVDEAASYFDSNIDDLLTEARKYRCGCVFAHQYLDQATHSLRASLAANTGIKFASGLSSGDARSMAPDMRTTADFILAQPSLQFAAHVRNVTPNAVSIPVKVGAFDRVPRLSHDAHYQLMDRNRERVSLPPGIAAPASPSAQQAIQPLQSPQGSDEDISSEW
ncbi:MAG: type IV secretory system conjugative DNA transfer family protein [Caulobacterales bacterium]